MLKFIALMCVLLACLSTNTKFVLMVVFMQSSNTNAFVLVLVRVDPNSAKH